ncbi:ComF family protein [Endozoicomonas montiporae]|nr:ComF family protein [Endozoicomonas montiporae]
MPVLVASTKLCGQCLKKTPVFNRCYSAFQYRFPVNHIIHRIKYSQQTALIKPMTASLAEVLRQHYHQEIWPEAIIPVPLHRKRLQQRGYNQALLLAKALNRQLKDKKMVLDKKMVKRIRATEAQQQLKASERLKNIRGAFVCRETGYRHVAIVDDVVTTGETVSELSRVLKKQGVKTIDVWCLVRTPAI